MVKLKHTYILKFENKSFYAVLMLHSFINSLKWSNIPHKVLNDNEYSYLYFQLSKILNMKRIFKTMRKEIDES